MKKKFSRFLLRLFGWKVIVKVPDFPKCVICVAPHTSNWDFLIGKLAYLSIGRSAGFLIKKDWFIFPLNLIFKAMGGVPVDRNRKTDMVDQIVRRFRESNKFCIAVTPEGTRKKTTQWKKGFYYIALNARVPIVLAYLDYERRTVGLEEVFYPTGDEKADMSFIKNYFRHFKAKHPENFTIG